MEIDVNKILPNPKNIYEAIDMISENGQKLVDAIFIMKSIMANPSETEFHNNKMKMFIAQFEKSELACADALIN